MADTTAPIVYQWRTIEPLSERDKPTNGVLGALDALREEWARRLAALSETDRQKTRQRSLRKLAIETGIIERLYSVDWGLTLTLVAEGFTKDVVERAGGTLDDRTLATLRAQMDSLEMVLDFVRNNRALSTSFIKDLHQAITRTQETYFATDALGRSVESTLLRGDWKKSPNHVQRQDGSILEYCPPEHVASEMDRLVALWSDLEREPIHPVVKTAWLHHRFVQIHPFADGNGRVARALTLLVLEKHHYAPLVVDRWHRAEYLVSLDQANDGDLRPLVRLLAKLENSALASELEQPEETQSGGLSVDIAHTLADQLAEIRKRRDSQTQRALEPRSIATVGAIDVWFQRKASALTTIFRDRGLNDVRVDSDLEQPPHSDKLHWFRHQIIDSARTAGHYANFQGYTAWVSLRVRIEGRLLRYVATLHGAGREPGVMAVTTFAEIETPSGPSVDGLEREYISTTKDAFRFVHSERLDQLTARNGELEDLLEEGLAEALAQLLSRQ